MSWIFALASHDPNLVGCVLQKMHATHPLRPGFEPEAYGLGYYQSGQTLVERHPIPRPGFDMLSQAAHMESEVILAQARGAGFMAKDENTQPFRFRNWLFAHAGRIEDWPRVRVDLHRSLPLFWQRQLHGETDGEMVGMFVLRRVRERGLLEEPEVSAPILGQAIRDGIADLEKLLRELSVPRQSPLALALTDGRVLAAARSGGPLSYRLFEGLLPCERCGLDERTPETHPLLRPHRQMRAVALISEEPSASFVALPDRSVLSLSTRLDLRIESFDTPPTR